MTFPSRSVLRSILVSVSLAMVPVAGISETLGDVLVSAYKNSNLLAQNRALLRATDEDYAVAVAALRPVINYVLNAKATNNTFPTGGYDTSVSATLSAQMTLFDWGGNKIGIEIAHETILATQQQLVGIEQQVLLGAVQAYMGVIQASEYAALRDNNLTLTQQEVEASRNRFALGETTRTDVALAEARLALSLANLTAAQGDLLSARERFKAITGHYPGALNPVPRLPGLVKNVEAAKALALRTHPSILAAQHQVKIAELAIEATEAGIKPQLSASARLTLLEDNNSDSEIGLSFGGPLYQGGQLTARYRQAIAQRDAARAALLEASVQVSQNVGLAWARREVAAAQLGATDDQIRAARVAYRGVKDEAALGSRTTLDVLDAEQQLLDAEASRISASSELNIATYAVLAEMGLMTTRYLELGVPTYDPGAYFEAVKKAPTHLVSPQGEKLDQILKTLGKN